MDDIGWGYSSDHERFDIYMIAFVSRLLLTAFLTAQTIIVSADDCVSFSSCESAAVKGDAAAQYKVGLMLDYGDGVVSNKAAAREWYSKAAVQGHIKAKFNAAVMHFHGMGGEENTEKGMVFYKESADKGGVRAQKALFKIYLKGLRGISQDHAEAIKWLTKAIEQNDIEAQYSLGKLYYFGAYVHQDLVKVIKYVIGYETEIDFKEAAKYVLGYGIPKNLEKAKQLFLEAAEKGNVESQYYLGNIYRDKQVKFTLEERKKQYPENHSMDFYTWKSLEWYRKAAEQGLPEAQYELAETMDTSFFYNEPPILTSNERLYWYKKSVESVYEPAIIKLAWIYSDRELAEAYDLTPKPKEVFQLYTKLVQSGSSEYQDFAQLELGRLFLNGVGVKQSYREAYKWFKNAALLGSHKAMIELGKLFSEGNGITQDTVRAYMMFFAFSKIEGAYNPEELEVLTNNMSPQQIEEAKALSQNWQDNL